MLVLKETYTDWNGVERTEEVCFNLTKSELMQMEASEDGGLQKKIQSIIDSQDVNQIMTWFKEILLKSYGVISDDGRRFCKNDEIRAAFEESPIFDNLFMRLATDADAANKFINGIIPKDLVPNGPQAIPANK